MQHSSANDNHLGQARPLAAGRSGPLKGVVRVPGDKSISHRALIFSGLATGQAEIRGLLEAEDTLNTASAMRLLGADVARDGDVWRIKGRGVGGLTPPDGPLDFGNSGTGVRLMMGVVAGHPMTVEFIGDASLSRRPMGRVLTPLKQMGLEVLDGDRDTLPLTVRGTSHLVPIEYRLPVPSAQVKSATLIAGLMARGETTVLEAEPTRDHTERMLRYLGAEIEISQREGGVNAITIHSDAELVGRDITVPGDPSSAAFLIAAACLVPGSDVTVEGVLVNDTRSGFYRTLREMGADIAFLNEREEGGEAIADIRARHGELVGVTVPPERAPSMIDEYPVLGVVAAFARGETRMRGLAELKVKESDRLAATAAGLVGNGVAARIEGDDLIVTGGGAVAGGGTVETHLDHRIAMSFLVLGLVARNPVTVDDGRMIQTSFTGFEDLMRGIGADIQAAPAAGRGEGGDQP